MNERIYKTGLKTLGKGTKRGTFFLLVLWNNRFIHLGFKEKGQPPAGGRPL